MNTLKYIKVWNYFIKRIDKIYCKNVYVSYPSLMSVRQGYGKLIPPSCRISFIKKKLKYKNWVKQSLGVCYEHSSSILLGLDMQDKCVIGKFEHYGNPNFCHAWNEFKYNNEWFVFDCANNFIYTKEDYYKEYNPDIIKSWTLEDVLRKYKNNNIIKSSADFTNPDEECLEQIKVTRPKLTMHKLYKDSIIKTNKKGEIISAEVPGSENG